MADIVWPDVVAVAATAQQLTVLSNILDTAQVSILAFVNCELSPNYFGGEDSPTYTRARALLAAHYAVMQSASTVPAGPVTGESAFGLARQYAAPPMLSWIMHPETSFGRLYDELVRGQPNRVGLTT